MIEPITSACCSPKIVMQIRNKAIGLRLKGYARLCIVPEAKLLEIYNGTGPEFLPDAVRARLDRIAEVFLPAVMIHDVDFAYSNGLHLSFEAVNDRLLHNCIVCAYNAEPWYSWRRYVLMLEAFVIYRACAKFGWIAWLSAFYKTKKKKGNHE